MMDDERFVDRAVRRLHSLISACVRYDNAEYAQPRDGTGATKWFGKIRQRTDLFARYASKRLDALAVQYLRSPPDDWSVGLLALLKTWHSTRANGKYEEALRHRLDALCDLARLVRNDATGPAARVGETGERRLKARDPYALPVSPAPRDIVSEQGDRAASLRLEEKPEVLATEDPDSDSTCPPSQDPALAAEGNNEPAELSERAKELLLAYKRLNAVSKRTKVTRLRAAQTAGGGNYNRVNAELAADGYLVVGTKQERGGAWLSPKGIAMADSLMKPKRK